MNKQGKELYLFITPSKAHFCKNEIPDYYFSIENTGKNDYELFESFLQESKINYFDSRYFIENYSGERLDAPVFYPTGIHWTFPWGYSAAIGFSEYISEHSKWELSSLALTESPCDAPNWPDADLYQTLNLLSEPENIQYYTASISVVEEKDRPNVFARGGSFMGQSISGLISAGVFEQNVHFENNYYFVNNYSTKETISAYDAYEEITEWTDLLKDADILILEINEANIYNFSFGFVDFLLEHPEYLEYSER